MAASENKIFQVAMTSLAAILTLDAASASDHAVGVISHNASYFAAGTSQILPLALTLLYILAGMKMGAWVITPGKARIAHASNRLDR